MLDQRGEWYLVRPVDSSDWRTGWINQTTVDEIQLQPDRTPSERSAPYPEVETAVMWALLSNREAADLSLPSWHPGGVNVAVAWNSNPWFGWELEGGAHFFSQEVFGTTLSIQEYTALTGPKFTFRQSDRVAPFLHLLTGPTFFFATDPLDSETVSDWDVGFQPGGGFDIIANERVAVRLGIDLRCALRTTRTSSVVAEPRHEAAVLGTVETGEVLEVLLEQGGWYLVRPLDDRSWGIAWVNEETVELMSLDVSAFTARTRSGDPAIVEDFVTARAADSRVMQAVGGATGADRDEVWYRLEAGASGRYEISTIRTSFDTALGLYNADNLSVIREHVGGGGTDPRIEAELAEGEYLIRVSGAKDESGTFTLEVTAPGERPSQVVVTPGPSANASFK